MTSKSIRREITLQSFSNRTGLGMELDVARLAQERNLTNTIGADEKPIRQGVRGDFFTNEIRMLTNQNPRSALQHNVIEWIMPNM